MFLYVEDKEKMLSRTLQLVELADETWLVTGRHPLPVITAATFLAWQSLRPSDRLTCSLARFCKLASVDLPYKKKKISVLQTHPIVKITWVLAAGAES